jgi:tetratricopeptide (TPR) repeat protein
LRRVPALAVGAADRLARLAVWWHGRYARLGESSVSVARLPSWLPSRLPAGTDRTGLSWTVAALDAERRATSTLHRMAVDAHRDVWPVAASRSVDIAAREAVTAHDSLRRAVAAVGPVDEALAWLTQELDLSDADLDVLSEAIGYPARSLGRTAVVLARRLLAMASDGLAADGLAADGLAVDGLAADGLAVDGAERRAALTAGLGARYSEIGRWDEARQHTEQAVAVFRTLAEQDRQRFLPDLASAVSNLASCLAQLGEREEALRHSYDAVTLHRELVADAPGRHLPELARALTNLSACLFRSGRRTAALGAAGQAVALYRELAEVNPAAYAGELSAADHNWQLCRSVLGEPAPGRPPGQRSDRPVN